ncbi:MAG: PEP-CTERM sorting domain-containing protein [Acidiferrobacteraceae bacterium]
MSLLLPTGVTYTSASGEFLTSPSPVPEPATWVTMACGFALLGLRASRGRNARATGRAS